MPRRRALFDYPSFGKGVSNLADAVFPSGQEQGRQSYYANEANTLKQKGQIRGNEYQARQRLADTIQNRGNFPTEAAGAVRAGDDALLGQMPGTHLAQVANNPDSTDAQIGRASVGAGHAMGPNSAYTLNDRAHIAGRNAQNKLSEALQVQKLHNQGAMGVQGLQNTGAMNRVQYKTENPDTVGGVMALHQRQGQLTDPQAANLRFGHGPDSGGDGIKPSGAVDLNKLDGTANQLIDQTLGIKRDKTGKITNSGQVADLDPAKRAEWVQAARNIMQQSNYKIGIDEAIQQAKDKVFPGGIHEVPAHGHLWAYHPPSVQIGGQQQPQTSQPQNQTQSQQPQEPQNTSIFLKGQTYTPQEIQENAQNYGMTVSAFRQYLLNNGGKPVG